MTERQLIQEREEISPASPDHAEAEDQAANTHISTHTDPAKVTNTGPLFTDKVLELATQAPTPRDPDSIYA